MVAAPWCCWNCCQIWIKISSNWQGKNLLHLQNCWEIFSFIYSRLANTKDICLSIKYTLLQNTRGGEAPPHPALSFLYGRRNIGKLYIIGKGIYRTLRFYFDIWKIFRFLEFMGNFREMAPEWLSEKNSNFQNMNILHIALKHVIWRFRICNYFREIIKFCNFSNFINFCDFYIS